MANKFIWLLVAILPISALAQQSTQSSQPNYLDEMAKVDAQIAYIQKKTELREALKKSANNEALPKILSIMVDDRGGTAQVVYSSGIVRWLKKGDALQDGIHVQAIEKSAVVAGGRGNSFRLAFFSPGASTATGASAGSGPLPPLPRINIPLPMPPSPSAAAPSAQLANPAAATALPATR